MKKKLGLRYAMSTVPLDPSCVRGTHGRLPETETDAPLLITSAAELVSDGATSIGAADVRDLVLAAHRAASAVPR